jgi:hypothetical protein
MTRLAGLRLRARWASGRQEPFTAESPHQVPVSARDGAGEGGARAGAVRP